jgi:hypothetical protein
MIQLQDGSFLSAAAPQTPNQAATINSELASLAGRAALRIPTGLTFERPVVLANEGATLLGMPGGSKIRVSPIGGGPAIFSGAPRPGMPLGPSLVPGGGSAMRIGHPGPWLDLSTEPNMDVGGLPAWTVECFIQLLSVPNDPKGVTSSQLNLGPVYSSVSWGIFSQSLNRFRIYWGGTYYETTRAAWNVAAVHHLAMVLNNQVVRVFVDGAIVLEFNSPTATVPQLPGRAEITAIGSHPSDPTGQNWACAGADGWVDSYRMSDCARYWEPFTPPAAKFVVDQHTLLLLNNADTDPDFVIGRVGNRGGLSWFRPKWLAERQMARVLVSDLTLDCGGIASGFCFQDTIASQFERLRADYAVYGVQCPGSTYCCSFREIDLITSSYGFVQGGQGEATTLSGLRMKHGGAIGYYANGAVGGSYSGVLISPQSRAIASIGIRGTSDINWLACQVDDEGQVPALRAAVLARGGAAKFFGGLIGTAAPGSPAFDCCDGGSVQLYGTSRYVSQTAAEVCRFRDAPATRPVDIGGIRYGSPAAPFTTSAYQITSL